MKLRGTDNIRNTGMDTNRLREIATIQSMTGNGVWSSDTNLWCAIDDLGVPGTLTDKPTHRIYSRYTTKITTSRRLLWGSVELYITKIRNIGSRSRWLEIECSEARLANWIESNGKTVTFYTLSSDAYSPSTGEVAQTEVANSVKVAGPDPYETNTIDGELILTGDCKISVPDEKIDFVPFNGQEIEIDSDRWYVQQVQKHYLGEYVDGYTCQLRV